MSSSATLQRRPLVKEILKGADDNLLVIGGLGSSNWDITNAGDRPLNMPLWGAMGAPLGMGLGLALAQPSKRVLVVTGDGELLMNIGALATVAILNPANFSILVVDNGHYGETGWQRSHTSLGVDLEKIAVGSGIQRTRTVSTDGEIADGARLLREGNGTAFVVLRVAPSEPPAYKRNFDLAACRNRFRGALLGAG